MKYLAAITALSLLASPAVYAQSDHSPSAQSPPQTGASSNDNQSSSEQENGQQPQLSQKFIRQIQRRLQQQGAFQGQPSGKWDQETADAIEQFQQDHNIQPSGQLDGATIIALMRPLPMQQQAMPMQGMEGSSSGSGSSSRPTGDSSIPTGALHAFQHGYEQGFEQGFATAIEQMRQQ